MNSLLTSLTSELNQPTSKASVRKDCALRDDDVLAFLRALDQHLHAVGHLATALPRSRICFCWRESRQLAAAVPCPSG